MDHPITSVRVLPAGIGVWWFEDAHGIIRTIGSSAATLVGINASGDTMAITARSLGNTLMAQYPNFQRHSGHMARKADGGGAGALGIHPITAPVNR
jgi:hypothetical protein